MPLNRLLTLSALFVATCAVSHAGTVLFTQTGLHPTSFTIDSSAPVLSSNPINFCYPNQPGRGNVL